MQWTGWALLFLWLAAALVPASGPDALEGRWEGFIVETPARRVLIDVSLSRVATGWEGSIDLPGFEGLPLSAVRSDEAGVHFELQAGDATVVFDAMLTGGSLSGQVLEGERMMRFDLRKLPAYPKPTGRVEAWRQDLDVVRSRFLSYDRSFDASARAAFEKAIGELEGSLSGINDQQVIVGLSAAVALSGNAHTRLYLLRNRTELRRLPVRLYWFTDGLFVVRATADNRDILGCKVSSLGGKPPADVRKQVARLFAGNASWVDYKSPYFMTSPEILYGLGLIRDMSRVPFTFDCPGHEPLQRVLAPLPLERKTEPTEAWRELSPVWPVDHGEWVSALPAGEPAPLYLQHPDRHYWHQYLGESRTLYVQYNRSQNMPEGASFADFAAEVEAIIGQQPIRRLVLDLRFNTGGDNGIAAPFIERLATLEKAGKLGRLFVILGRATFSAGISHAAYLKQHSGAVFVGEPIGDELDIWSEGGNIVLPNSQLTIHFTNGFHSLSSAEHPENEPYEWSDLDLESLSPDILVREPSGDYFSGVDPAMRAIAADQGYSRRVLTGAAAGEDTGDRKRARCRLPLPIPPGTPGACCSRTAAAGLSAPATCTSISSAPMSAASATGPSASTRGPTAASCWPGRASWWATTRPST